MLRSKFLLLPGVLPIMLSRREFLASGVLAAASPLLAGERPLPTTSLWLAPATGLLEDLAGPDICQQLRVAADLGFPAFSEPDWLQLSPQAADQLADAARRCGLRCGPARAFVAAASLRDLRGWEQRITRELVALQHGGVSGLRLELGAELQNALQRNSATREAWLASCRRLADTAGTARQTLLLEPLPGSSGDATWVSRWVSVLDTARHPAWKLSCDTYLWGRAGFDWSALSPSVAALIGHVELADFPGGGPAGTGKLPLASFLANLQRAGYSGVVALRHGPVTGGFSHSTALVDLCDALLTDVSRSLQQHSRLA